MEEETWSIEEIEERFLTYSGSIGLTVNEFVRFIRDPENSCDWAEWRSLLNFLPEDHWLNEVE